MVVAAGTAAVASDGVTASEPGYKESARQDWDWDQRGPSLRQQLQAALAAAAPSAAPVPPSNPPVIQAAVVAPPPATAPAPAPADDVLHYRLRDGSNICVPTAADMSEALVSVAFEERPAAARDGFEWRGHKLSPIRLWPRSQRPAQRSFDALFDHNAATHFRSFCQHVALLVRPEHYGCT